jgi:amino acid transporter
VKPGLDITAFDPRFGARRLGLVPLICLLYLVVSGGAYGLEDAVGIAGPRLTLLLCAIVPLTLSIPSALMAAELTALMPAEGGFYLWVKQGLGPFAGFVEAYLTLLFTIADSALYPVLFATYWSSLGAVGTASRLILGVGLIWGCGLLNLAGVRTVGRTSVGFTAALLTPFAAMVVIGLPRLLYWQPPSQPLIGQPFLGALGGGLLVVMWNFGGWENLSIAAGEIDVPRRNYLRAIKVAITMVVLGYLLPLGVTLSGAGATADWHAGTFAREGARLGGPLLGIAIGLGGTISAFAMFEAALLWVSRLPFVLAGEGYLPPGLATVWEARSIPGRSIVICCVAFTLLLPLGFLTLLTFDVFFYMAALALEMCALVRLRRLYPARAGLFVIGGGRLGLYVVVAAPLATWLVSLGFATAQGRAIDLIIAIVLAAGVWPAHAILRRRYGGPSAH